MVYLAEGAIGLPVLAVPVLASVIKNAPGAALVPAVRRILDRRG
jgi:hypothetical protein